MLQIEETKKTYDLVCFRLGQASILWPAGPKLDGPCSSFETGIHHTQLRLTDRQKLGSWNLACTLELGPLLFCSSLHQDC